MEAFSDLKMFNEVIDFVEEMNMWRQKANENMLFC